MGAWNVMPNGNDEAEDWMASSIEYPILEAIEKALQRLAIDSSDDVAKAEAEVAIALLVDLTSNADNFQYVQIKVHNLASKAHLWEQAAFVITALLSDEKWISEWTSPDKKTDLLRRLLADLELAKARAMIDYDKLYGSPE